jgi:uncharacterized protein
LALTLIVPLTAGAADVPRYEIRWGTSPPGGSWPVLGSAMLEHVLKAYPNLTGSTVPMGGAANLLGVHLNKLNIAFSFSDVMGDAWEGMEDFKNQGKVRDVRVLASLFPEPTQCMVNADSGITSVPELKGKRVSPGPKGSAIEVVTRRIFEAYGMTAKDVRWTPLPFNDAAEQMIDKQIDAICYGAMIYPAPNLINVATQRNVKLLPLSDEVVHKMVTGYKGITPFTLRSGSYRGVDYPVKGISSETILVVREDMPDEVAYAIAKSIADNFKQYVQVTTAMTMGSVDALGKDVGFPYHPGAMKYYKEKGIVK